MKRFLGTNIKDLVLILKILNIRDWIFNIISRKIVQNRLDYLLLTPKFLYHTKDVESWNRMLSKKKVSLNQFNRLSIIKKTRVVFKTRIKSLALLYKLPKNKHDRLLITGAGRSCTNWVKQICMAMNKYKFEGINEDRIFPWRILLGPNYAAKLACENNGFTKSVLNKKLKRYEDLKIIWCFKHPIANSMAKIVRGQPRSLGGDAIRNMYMRDATVKTASIAINKSYRLYTYFKNKFPSRVLLVKLEDLIVDPELQLKKICDFLSVQYSYDYLFSFKDTSNIYHKKRYGQEIDKSQLKIFENWDTVYNNFFQEKRDSIEKLIDNLKPVCKALNYSFRLTDRLQQD